LLQFKLALLLESLFQTWCLKTSVFPWICTIMCPKTALWGIQMQLQTVELGIVSTGGRYCALQGALLTPLHLCVLFSVPELNITCTIKGSHKFYYSHIKLLQCLKGKVSPTTSCLRVLFLGWNLSPGKHGFFGIRLLFKFRILPYSPNPTPSRRHEWTILLNCCQTGGALGLLVQ
jgi:hypothetical protein